MSLNKRTVTTTIWRFFFHFFVEDELLDKAFTEVPDTSEDKPNETDSNKKDGIDFTSLKSLEKDGIDMSFLESLQKYNDQSKGNWVDDTQ